MNWVMYVQGHPIFYRLNTLKFFFLFFYKLIYIFVDYLYFF